MESKEFEGFEILEKENIDQDVARIKVDQEYQQREQKLLEDAGKTKNDLGKGEKKKGGGLFSSITSVFDRGKKKDKKQKKDDIYNIGIELEELDGGLLEEDEVGDELNKVLKNYKEEDDDDKAEKNMGEAEDNDSEKNTGDEIEEVGVGLDDILKNFKTGDNKAENDQQNIGNELEALHDELDEDEEEEEEEPDEYVYDSKLHWGTTNLLHSFLYHKGEKYKFSEHGKVRNWFHKKFFGSHRSQEKSRRALEKAKKDHIKSEEESGRFYGDDVAYKRWEHNGARNWFHDKWYHMKNAHRKAVDRFYHYEDDYRKMPWYKRAIWCVKNPLARIMVNFPRSRFGTQARENLLDRMRKLYRQAISEGIIPRTKLGDLDYDPLTGIEGSMTRASELKQAEADEKFRNKLSAEDIAKKNGDLLRVGRAGVMRQLLVMNRQKDLLMMRSVSEGVDPNQAVLLFMKDEGIRTSYIKHLEGLRKADWEIAKQDAAAGKGKMPDEADDPEKNPLNIGDSDEDTIKLLEAVNRQMGIAESPLQTPSKSTEELEKEFALVEATEQSNFYINVASYGSLVLQNAGEVSDSLAPYGGTLGFAIGGGAALGKIYDALDRANKAAQKGDKRAQRDSVFAFVQNLNGFYYSGVNNISKMSGMSSGLAGALLGPSTSLTGAMDAVNGWLARNDVKNIKKEMEALKEEQEDKTARKYKMINMAGQTADAEKDRRTCQMVSGFLNTVSGVMTASGALSTLGLVVYIAATGVGILGGVLEEGQLKDNNAKNVNTEMGLVERQRLLWEYYLKKGGQPNEYTRGITKRAVLMEEGFEKGTRKQGAIQQRISYAQKITDNLNSDNPDPAYLKLVKAMRIDKGRDNMYHMEVILKYLGMDTKNVARDFLESTSDNEFKDAAARLSKRNELIKSELKNSLGKGRTLVGEDIVERARRLKQSSRPVKEKDINKQPVKKQEEMIEMDNLNEKKEEE